MLKTSLNALTIGLLISQGSWAESVSVIGSKQYQITQQQNSLSAPEQTKVIQLLKVRLARY